MGESKSAKGGGLGAGANGETGAKKAGKSGAKKVFAKGVGFEKLVMLFIVGCLFGYFYEVIFNFIEHLITNGEFFFERRSGVIYGPFSVIYGAGAVLMAAVLAEKNYKWWQLFIYGGLLCGVCEYIVGWLQEVFTGTISWDYSDHFMNFNGRTSLQVLVIWGVIAMIYIGAIYPWLAKWIEKIPAKIGGGFVKFMTVFLAIDMAISFAAVIRMGMRRENIPPATSVGEVIDALYPDEFMKWAYPNTEFIEEHEKSGT